MWYRLVKRLFVLSVNTLNVLLAGNLPPFVTVCAIVEERGRVLVIEPSKDHFTFPGGFVRWREQPAQAVIREAKEEAGLHLSIKCEIGYYPCPASRFGGVSCVTIVFCAEIMGGTLRNSTEGKARWLREQEFHSGLSAFNRRVFNDYLNLSLPQSILEAVK